MLASARSVAPHDLAQMHLGVPTDEGANAGLKVSSLVVGMAALASSIDGVALLRYVGTARIFPNAYARC